MDDTKGTTCAPVYDDGTLRITPTLHPSGIRLEGELDRSGVIGLMAALAAATHIAVQDGGLCHADLSELDFIDDRSIQVANQPGWILVGRLPRRIVIQSEIGALVCKQVPHQRGLAALAWPRNHHGGRILERRVDVVQRKSL